MSLQLGHKVVKGEADYVIWSGDSERSFPIVVEAKKPKVCLDKTVANQARSYSFAVGADTYVITNGDILKIFKIDLRGGDECILSCHRSELKASWDDVKALMGKRNGEGAQTGRWPFGASIERS